MQDSASWRETRYSTGEQATEATYGSLPGSGSRHCRTFFLRRHRDFAAGLAVCLRSMNASAASCAASSLTSELPHDVNRCPLFSAVSTPQPQQGHVRRRRTSPHDQGRTVFAKAGKSSAVSLSRIARRDRLCSAMPGFSSDLFALRYLHRVQHPSSPPADSRELRDSALLSGRLRSPLSP